MSITLVLSKKKKKGSSKVPTLTSNCALIVSIDARWSLSMKFFIWPISSGVLTFLLLPHLSSSLTDCLSSLNLLCHLQTDARWPKSSLKHSIRFCGIFFQVYNRILLHIVLLKCPNVQIACLKFTSVTIRVYSNCCCSCLLEPEIIKIGQSSHNMYSNNILNFQEPTTILNGCTKNAGNFLNSRVCVCVCVFMSVCVCVCVRVFVRVLMQVCSITCIWLSSQ